MIGQLLCFCFWFYFSLRLAEKSDEVTGLVFYDTQMKTALLSQSEVSNESFKPDEKLRLTRHSQNAVNWCY